MTHIPAPHNPDPEPGCYVDNHWGQYAIARAIKVALNWGWEDEEAQDLADRHLAAMMPSESPSLDHGEFELLVDAADDAEAWLNDNCCIENHYWGWNDGDFGLYSYEEEA